MPPILLPFRYAYDGTITNYPELCWAWVASFIGPVVYILAWTHAVMWKKVTAVIESAVSCQQRGHTVYK